MVRSGEENWKSEQPADHMYSQLCPHPVGHQEWVAIQSIMCCRCPPWEQPWHHTYRPRTCWWLKPNEHNIHFKFSDWNCFDKESSAPQISFTFCWTKRPAGLEAMVLWNLGVAYHLFSNFYMDPQNSHLMRDQAEIYYADELQAQCPSLQNQISNICFHEDFMASDRRAIQQLHEGENRPFWIVRLLYSAFK